MSYLSKREEYDNILNAIIVCVDYERKYSKITDWQSIPKKEHSRFLNACNILRGVNLSGMEIADLLLTGDKNSLEKIIRSNQGNRINSST